MLLLTTVIRSPGPCLSELFALFGVRFVLKWGIFHNAHALPYMPSEREMYALQERREGGDN